MRILKDGASSIYGSDAIAGVVNIITRKDFQGLQADAYFGTFEDGEGDNTQINVTMGSTGDNHALVMSFGYLEVDVVNSRDRGQAGFPVPNTGSRHGSSGTPQGRFLFTDPNTGMANNLTINDGVTGIPAYNPATPGIIVSATNPFNPLDSIYSPTDSVSLGADLWKPVPGSFSRTSIPSTFLPGSMAVSNGQTET